MTFFCCLLFLVIWLDNYSISKVLRVFIYLNKQKMNVCNWSNCMRCTCVTTRCFWSSDFPASTLFVLSYFDWIKINRCFLYVYFVLYKFIYLLVKKSIVKIWTIWKIRRTGDTDVFWGKFCRQIFDLFSLLRIVVLELLRQRDVTLT